MDPTDQQVTGKFTEFGKTRDTSALYQALDAIEKAESAIPPGDTEARNLALARRLHFLAELDRFIDPLWNEKNIPPQGVTPPESHGIVYGSGEVDPAGISDPVARAKYVEALQVNKEARKQYSLQQELRDIDRRAMLFLSRLIEDRYSDSTADRQQFEHLLAASDLSESRRQQMRALPAEHH